MRTSLAIVLLATSLAGCYGTPASRPAPLSSAADSDIADPSIQSIAGLPAGAQPLDLEADTGGCEGTRSSKFAVIAIERGEDFQTLFPHAGRTPELGGIAHLHVVIYEAGWPGLLLGPIGAPARSFAAESWDVCVRRIDGESIGGLPFIVYGDVPREESPIASQ
jgi:hypothetical protein